MMHIMMHPHFIAERQERYVNIKPMSDCIENAKRKWRRVFLEIDKVSLYSDGWFCIFIYSLDDSLVRLRNRHAANPDTTDPNSSLIYLGLCFRWCLPNAVCARMDQVRPPCISTLASKFLKFCQLFSYQTVTRAMASARIAP